MNGGDGLHDLTRRHGMHALHDNAFSACQTVCYPNGVFGITCDLNRSEYQRIVGLNNPDGGLLTVMEQRRAWDADGVRFADSF